MINTDRLSLFSVVTGPRGSCKTLFMTAKVCETLLRSYFLRMTKGVNKRVWTNYPVGFSIRSPFDGKRVRLSPEPLNMEALYTFDDELVYGWVYIDEIDQWYDRQDWQAVTQKLMNKVMTQIRKKRLQLMATLQDISWLNPRGQFQTDINVKCREAAFTPWGRKLSLELGECSFLSFRDKSGVMTGYTYEETGRDYSKMFWGKRFWKYYDTDYQFNPLETATKYKLKAPTKILEIGGRPDDADNIDPLRSEQKDANFVLISDIVEELRDLGYESLSKPEMRDYVATRGVDIGDRRLERYLRLAGIGTFGKYTLKGYDLSSHTQSIPPNPQLINKEQVI